MSKQCIYTNPRQVSQTVDEPLAEYHTLSMQKGCGLLPDEIIVGAAQYARNAREKGQMIPHEDVYGLLADRLGWK